MRADRTFLFGHSITLHVYHAQTRRKGGLVVYERKRSGGGRGGVVPQPSLCCPVKNRFVFLFLFLLFPFSVCSSRSVRSLKFKVVIELKPRNVCLGRMGIGSRVDQFVFRGGSQSSQHSAYKVPAKLLLVTYQGGTTVYYYM